MFFVFILFVFHRQTETRVIIKSGALRIHSVKAMADVTGLRTGTLTFLSNIRELCFVICETIKQLVV